MTRAACTIISLNYLPYARALYDSFRRFHSDVQFYTLIVDRLPAGTRLSDENFAVIFVDELRIPNFPSIAFKYDLLALNTNVKPSFMKFLLETGIEQLIYVDPDVFIYSSLDPVFRILNTCSILLTPHSTSPNEHNLQAEISLLMSGTYNLGFIAVSNTSETSRFLAWWENRCLNMAFNDLRSGLFVDQKWINLVPVYFPSVHILRNPGCNVAYWNLHERSIKLEGGIWFVDNQPLVFFHFSGVNVDGGSRISKFTDQFTLENRPELKELFLEYRECLVAHGIRETSRFSYAFGKFENGQNINRLTRALYAANLDKFGNEDPFKASSSLYKWAKEAHILGSKETADLFTSTSYPKTDPRLTIIHFLLRQILHLVGPDSYTMLMKYLSYVSVLRNQRDVFGG